MSTTPTTPESPAPATDDSLAQTQKVAPLAQPRVYQPRVWLSHEEFTRLFGDEYAQGRSMFAANPRHRNRPVLPDIASFGARTPAHSDPHHNNNSNNTTSSSSTAGHKHKHKHKRAIVAPLSTLLMLIPLAIYVSALVCYMALPDLRNDLFATLWFSASATTIMAVRPLLALLHLANRRSAHG